MKKLFYIYFSVVFGLVFGGQAKKDISIPSSLPVEFITSSGPSARVSEPMSNSSISQTNRDTRDQIIWSDDLEGDVSSWTTEDHPWELSSESSFSPSHSFKFDDNNYGLEGSIITPTISIPDELDGSDNYHLEFAIWCDLPDYDGTGDNYLEDYYSVQVAENSGSPSMFHPSSVEAYADNSWHCANSEGGYDNGWLEFLDTPPIYIADDSTYMTAMMKWDLESPDGASDEGTCTDGWDAANVRISNDGGQTWSLLVGSDPYDFNFGYGWIWNDSEYDCGGSLENLSSGWGGQADWHEVFFDLAEYSGQEVIIRFAFGSDASYNTYDDPTITGLRVDEITIASSSNYTGGQLFFDNADTDVNMIPFGSDDLAWEILFYDYGGAGRPGGTDWAEYLPGMPFNNNIGLDLTPFKGKDIKIRFKAMMDDNDDGGNGSGLFIDDIKVVRTTDNSSIPIAENLRANNENGLIAVSWDSPPISFDNDLVNYDDGTFEDHVWMSSGTALTGTYFSMPSGSENVFVHTGSVYGVDNASGSTVLYGYDIIEGVPSVDPTYQTEILTVVDSWTEFQLDWQFSGDFLLAIEITTSIGAAIDTDNGQGMHSWMYLGGWSPYSDIASEYGLADGEFGIRASVTTDDGLINHSFNVYKSVNNDGFSLLDNGTNISDSHYDDYIVENDNEYCYEVTTVLNGIEGNPTDPACVIYNSTDSGNSEITFVADISNIDNFDSEQHTMEVRGSFNGWTSENPMSYTGNGIFVATIPIDGDAGELVEWKFKAGPDYVWENNGWEMGGNRSFEITGQDQTLGPYEPNIQEVNADFNNIISVETVYGLPGDTVDVGVYIDLDQGYSLYSFAISFEGFDNQPVVFLGTNDNEGLAADAGWSISSNSINSIVATASAGSNTIEGSGNLFSLRFAINDDASGTEVSINPIDILLNEDYFPVEVTTGSIIIPDSCSSNFVSIFCNNGDYQSEVSWTLVNSSGEEVLSGGAPYESDHCLPSDVYTLFMYDSWGDGWNGNIWLAYDYVSDSISTILTLDDGTEGSDIFILGDAEFTLGCMDPEAVNYDPSVTMDDGSCYYDGDVCSVAIEAVSGEPGNQADGNDEWFSFTSTIDGYITITTCYANQPEDTDVKIYSGCPDNGGYLIDGNDDAYCGGVTGGNEYASDLTVVANAGETFYIFWDDTWNPVLLCGTFMKIRLSRDLKT